MIKKILLIDPPNTMPADSIKRITEPLSLLYVGAMLKKHGYDVKVFDMACEGYNNRKVENDYVTYGSSENELKKMIVEERPDIVGVGCIFTAREKNALDVCRAVKSIDKNMPIVMGGLHPTLFPENFLQEGLADYVIMGEGEFRMLKLLACLEEKKIPDFDGIAYRTHEGYRSNKMKNRIEDLDSLPLPDRDLIDMEKYIEIGTPFAPFAHKKRVAQVLATRGCPNRCNFCSSVNYWGRKIRARSVGNILGEMRILKDKYGIEEIQFVDDNLTFDRKFCRELFIGMKDFNFKWCTPNGLMFNTLDGSLIKLMAESGAYQLSFAIESGSERVLKEIIHKNVDLKIVKDVIKEAHRYDISIHGMFLMGFPGEKKEEIMKTLDFPFSAGFDSVSFFIVNPLPGSDLYDFCKKRGYLTKDYSSMDFKTANIIIPKNSPDYNMDPGELVKLVDQKTHEFNEWAKKEHPERWRRKFERYLGSHPDQAKIITGRVT